VKHAWQVALRWDSDWIRIGERCVAQSWASRFVYSPHWNLGSPMRYSCCSTRSTRITQVLVYIYGFFFTAHSFHWFSAGFLTALFRFSTFPLNIRTREPFESRFKDKLNLNPSLLLRQRSFRTFVSSALGARLRFALTRLAFAGVRQKRVSSWQCQEKCSREHLQDLPAF